MPSEKLYKTVCQYSKGKIPCEDMRRLQEIASDYSRVKNYVYGRFGGIKGLSKLYPGYTAQNEMTQSGLRAELGLPSVYFYLAVSDALRDIRSQWTRTKTKVLKQVSHNEGFNEADRHYLRFLVRISSLFESVLNQAVSELPEEIRKRYEELVHQVEPDKLHRYLRRQVRKHHRKPHTDRADGFSISAQAYRYEDHGIYVATKEKRRRIYIPLTDSCRYTGQLYIRLYPEEERLEIRVPLKRKIRRHEDYRNRVGIALGINTMLTTDKGSSYGEELGRYETEYADWVREQSAIYNRNRQSNPGRKKYRKRKRRCEEQLHSYINHELNHFLEEEKPKRVYMISPPKAERGGDNRRINNMATLWQRGYIRRRLEQKCAENAVEIVEVMGKGISRECSRCGGEGIRKEGIFTCGSCGYRTEEKKNAAENVLKRGLEGKVIRQKGKPEAEGTEKRDHKES